MLALSPLPLLPLTLRLIAANGTDSVLKCRRGVLTQAVKLESAHPAGRTRYLVVVSRTGSLGAEEACLLGIDCNSRTTIGLVIPVWADSRITLDGDGGFSVTSSSGHYIFKPVSVQAMWQCPSRFPRNSVAIDPRGEAAVLLAHSSSERPGCVVATHSGALLKPREFAAGATHATAVPVAT
ncbi:hypothetical protein HPB49_022688 [Dermacentor silvarum]|uniref:Uncharacterized protein n=1 Tax=Dermacentor silvarum TaxID=543639 RepID=A0ACB8D8F3_DERSI|nr:hypothetical protein HPB49_022688 [Dermacentor silvarum]